jgi:hypothetical protein
MTRPNPSTQMRNPIPDVDEEGTRIYVALLTRRCVFLAHENLRFRACLERATGVQWDDTNLGDPTSEELDELVAQDIARGLQMSIEDARKLVSQNKAMANPSQKETPAPE